MDILLAYNFLLGRPLIHSAGVVLSTLHQKLKFMVDDKLIIVSGKEDFLVSGPMTTRYMEALETSYAEEALETSYQALEIVNTEYVEPFQITPYLSSASSMMVKTMMRKGYKYEKGLGKDGKGSVFHLQFAVTKNRYG